MKKIVVLLFTIIAGGCAFGQQELMISQYMFNGMVLNPAYAGSHPYWSASLLHRSQWVKFDNAPTTQTFSIDGPIANRKFGMGLTVSNDQLGITKQLEVGVNFAAKVALGSGNLAAGIRVAGANYTANLSDAVIWDTQDPVYANNIKNELVPKVGLGLYYYQRKWYAGVSVPTVYSSDDKIIPSTSSASRFFENHYYFNAGYVFEVTPTLAIKPSTLIKYQPEAPVEADINCNFLFFKKFWLGAGYRTGDALVAMAEWNITPQLRLGYAYDYTLTDIANYSSGSHEVMLGFDFGKDVNIKTRSPRYF
ncbi:MAG: type IX secretion system membrane protein PorP/SprF [Crocinitomicaceae bacterium]|nr:type IX secretion system membrane protein PorP/SprF [Crocinitomicaceae bacterium]